MKARFAKNLKRFATVFVCLALVVVLCFGIAACGGESSDSSSIYIGDDGYWYIDGENTGVKAQGEDGKDGADGKDGKDGSSAGSTVEEISVENITETTVSATGVTSGDLEAQGKFYTDYSSEEEAQEAAQVLNIQMAQEGQVLLKNEDEALPLNKNERNVTLLGIAAADLTVSGGGSGAATQTSAVEAYDWQSGLEAAGFNVNPKTMELYNNYLEVNAPIYDGSALEIDVSNYSPSITSTFKGYNDAAIVVLHRWGTENSDLTTYGAEGHSAVTDTELDLQDNEKDLIMLAKKNFDKVIVILNSSNTMSVGPLAEDKTADNLGVDAILWVGGVGQVGTYAAGTILTGETNPSGKTVDTWWNDVKDDPSFTNMSNMAQTEDGTAFFTDTQGNETSFATVEYREDIYMGYRYAETGYTDLEAASSGAGEEWYDDLVAYPFGYGLTYTDFTWQLAGISSNRTISAKNQTITLKIKVTNTGSVAGKDVVEVYYSAPYTSGGIEKSAANLAGFAKTKLLQPGKSDTVTVQFVAQDMASFDWSDANGNGFKGYELEAGTYTISARNSSHETVISEDYTIASDILCDTDYTTGEKIEPVFDPDGDYTTVRDSLLDNLLSRADGMSQPASETNDDRKLASWEENLLNSEFSYYPYNDSASDPWYASSVPSTWTQNAETSVTLDDLSGVTYKENKIGEDGVVDETATDSGTQMWESYMNSLSWDDIVSVVADTKSNTFGGHDFSGTDGPVKFGNGTCWSTSPVSAATWNERLLELQGEMYGTEAIFNGNSAWHGGGLDTHRSPFNGRNFEYYSEDGTLAGIMGAAVCKGVTSKGVVAYYKHFFGNDQEYKRAEYGGVCEFATEQAYREIYLKPFEYVVKAGSLGLMTSFNRIGYVVNSNNYAVHEALLRDEWGFKGCTITDMWAKNYVSLDLMARAGDDIVLGGDTSFTDTYFANSGWDATQREGKGLPLVPSSETEGQNQSTATPTVASPTEYYAMRKSAQRVLYAAVNSNWMYNHAENMELTASVYAGFSNSALISSSETTDFTVTVDTNDASVLTNAGLSVSGQVVTASASSTEGVYTVNVTISCDSWIETTGTLTIKVCSPVSADGEDICLGESEPLATISAGSEYSVTFSSNFYTPHSRDGSYMYVNWYKKEDNTVFNRDEDKSAADIVTYPVSDAAESHEFKYTITDGQGVALTTTANESGWYIEEVWTSEMGVAGVAYDCNTGITLKNDGTATAGSYTFTVTITVPYTMCMNGWLFTFLTGDKTVTRQITIVVE